MSRGKRVDTQQPKLNIKKVIAVIIAVIVIIMFIIAIKNLLKTDSSSNNLISTTYFLINRDNKWGIMDNNTKIVIEPIYDEAIIIPNNKKDIFICTCNVNYENNTYQTKVLNSKNEEIFTEYETVNAIENYDKNHNLWYEDNVLLVQKNGKYGLINFDGKEILDPIYDKINALKGIKNSIITVQNNKKGLVNCLGQQIIENEYDDIELLGENTESYIIKKNNLYGINEILECKYEEIKPLDNNEIFCVKENKQYKVINKNKQVVFNEKFDNIKTIQNNIIVYQLNNKYSAYDIKENKKLDKFYKELIYTANQFFIAKTDNNYGIIDINNNVKLEQKYKNINFYQDVEIYELEEKDNNLNTVINNELEEIAYGIVNECNYNKSYIKIWTESGYEYYNLNGEKKEAKDVLVQNNLFLSKQNNKYGFVNKDGKIVVDYLYDDATEQNEFGYVAVKKDGLWGCIDKNGNIICETKYNLDNHLLINFIGEFYLGEDLNLMYYTNKI